MAFKEAEFLLRTHLENEDFLVYRMLRDSSDRKKSKTLPGKRTPFDTARNLDASLNDIMKDFFNFSKILRSKVPLSIDETEFMHIVSMIDGRFELEENVVFLMYKNCVTPRK